jgi:uncharacterized protein (TIGR00255 family)
MLASMTGFASASYQDGDHSFQLEIKTVNHRFLEINFKLAEELKSLEGEIRKLITHYVSRAKIDIKITCKNSTVASLELNNAALHAGIALIQQLQTQIPENILRCTLRDILALPGIFSQDSADLIMIDQPRLLHELHQLLQHLVRGQHAEGLQINNILTDKLQQLTAVTDHLYSINPTIIAAYKEQLIARLHNALGDAVLNEVRLQQEIVFFCQKIDVTEEIDRLKAHIHEFAAILQIGSPAGKKLDFLCQEMNREANTFGSKSAALLSTNKAIELKLLIEQLREQVQNVM